MWKVRRDCLAVGSTLGVGEPGRPWEREREPGSAGRVHADSTVGGKARLGTVPLSLNNVHNVPAPWRGWTSSSATWWGMISLGSAFIHRTFERQCLLGLLPTWCTISSYLSAIPELPTKLPSRFSWHKLGTEKPVLTRGSERSLEPWDLLWQRLSQLGNRTARPITGLCESHPGSRATGQALGCLFAGLCSPTRAVSLLCLCLWQAQRSSAWRLVLASRLTGSLL